MRALDGELGCVHLMCSFRKMTERAARNLKSLILVRRKGSTVSIASSVIPFRLTMKRQDALALQHLLIVPLLLLLLLLCLTKTMAAGTRSQRALTCAFAETPGSEVFFLAWPWRPGPPGSSIFVVCSLLNCLRLLHTWRATFPLDILYFSLELDIFRSFLPCSILLFFALSLSTLLYASQFCSTLPYSTLICSALFPFT
jgi:hypothetical protein